MKRQVKVASDYETSCLGKVICLRMLGVGERRMFEG